MLLDELRGGAPVGPENLKLAVIERLLALRAPRPESFAGDYEPRQAGPCACAFLRGVATCWYASWCARAWREGTLVLRRAGHWRDMLGAHGEARELTAGEPLADLLDEHEIAVLERA